MRTTEHPRELLTAPLTWQDGIDLLLIGRGVNPRTRTSPKRGPPVKVVGGPSTPEIEASARAWARAGLAGDWARSTGSDPAAIARAMSFAVTE